MNPMEITLPVHVVRPLDQGLVQRRKLFSFIPLLVNHCSYRASDNNVVCYEWGICTVAMVKIVHLSH